ncbi:hypothetical protein, partial [Moritella viscosa]|uniref:hypothetical protein n=1 Tax=Moritella viscosa TaxID=80854 RepID=UPI000A7AC5F8
ELTITIDPYFFDNAILSILSLSIGTTLGLELHLTINQKVSQILVYKSEHETDVKMPINLNAQYLLLFAQQCKGQVIRNNLNNTITLEIPNVLS